MRTQRFSQGLRRVSQQAERGLLRSNNSQACVTQTRQYRYTPVHVYDERNIQLLYSKAEIKDYLEGFVTPKETGPEIEEDKPNPQEKRLEQLAQNGRLKEVIFHLKNVSTNTLNRKRTYDILFKALSGSQDHYKEIPLLRTVFGRSGIQTSEEQLDVISGLIGRKEFAEALRTMDELRQSNANAVPSWLDNKLIQLLITVDAQQALSHLQALTEKSPSFQPDFKTHDVVLQHYAARDLEKAEQYFAEISTRFNQSPDNHLHNILINAYVQKGDLEQAYQTIRRMEAPIRPNLDSFQKLLEEHEFRGNKTVVTKLQAAMENKYKIVPDREFFHGMLDAIVRRDPTDLSSQFKGLLRMRRAGHEPDVRAFNVIFRVAADVGARKTVNHFFNKLKFRFFDLNEQVPIEMGQDLYPDAQSYHYILSGYVKNKFLTQAYEFYRFMNARKVDPLPETTPLIDQILQHHRNSSAIVTPKE